MKIWQDLLVKLDKITKDYSNIAFATSFGAEDMVITHAIFEMKKDIIEIFTLDTGRLHIETKNMINVIKEFYNLEIKVFSPNKEFVEDHVEKYGLFSFYESLDLRKACCHIRKIEPLKLALSDKEAWITGQRKEQSNSRSQISEEEDDLIFNLKKFNPLAFWMEEDVWKIIKKLGIPSNPLHQKGYPSIGCEPCTRAIRPGEDFRAGRWWWEINDKKECGLHSENQISNNINYSKK